MMHPPENRVFDLEKLVDDLRERISTEELGLEYRSSATDIKSEFNLTCLFPKRRDYYDLTNSYHINSLRGEKQSLGELYCERGNFYPSNRELYSGEDESIPPSYERVVLKVPELMMSQNEEYLPVKLDLVGYYDDLTDKNLGMKRKDYIYTLGFLPVRAVNRAIPLDEKDFLK